MATADPPGRYPDPLEEHLKAEAGITDLTPDFWVEFGTETHPFSPTEKEKRWPFRQEQVTGKHTRILRRDAQVTQLSVMRQIFEGDHDIDTMTQVWWLARVQNGERVTYEECEDRTSMASYPCIVWSAGDEDPDSPEA
jgi:hypothetical protein